MIKPEPSHSPPIPAAEPDFIGRRVDRYFGERRAAWPRGRHILRGRNPEAGAVLMMSNDYLCLADHPEIVAARHPSPQAEPSQLMAAVFLDGDSIQGRFQQEMATFLDSQDTVLCQSGWDANVGLVQAFTGPEVPVYIDIRAHASLWEGIHSGGAQPVAFRHNDVAHLEKLVRKRGPGLVIVDSVYSTHGDVAPLAELAVLTSAHGCALVVDESHSLGTHGPGGRGLVVEMGLTGQVHFRTASLAKAFAGRAGIVACSRRHAEYFKYHARSAVFSSGVLGYEIEGLRAMRRLIEQADARREALRRNTRLLRAGLADLGLGVGIDGEQIVALVAGAESATIELRDALEARGVFGSVFCAPATPVDGSLVRLTVNSELTTDQLQRVIDACAALRGEIDVDAWPANRRRTGTPRSLKLARAA